MESRAVGELVKVATGGPPVDGIVFDAPSAMKVVVVVVDPGRGPAFRTVHPETLSTRMVESSDDRALLIRRTPSPPTARPVTGRALGADTPTTRAATHRSSDH
jgi:hypothetical protein